VLDLEELGKGLSLLKRDHHRQHVAGQGQVERTVGLAMPVAVLPPRAGIPLVVVAVLHRPVTARRLLDPLLLARVQAGKKVSVR
jgi:hypothetical protein